MWCVVCGVWCMRCGVWSVRCEVFEATDLTTIAAGLSVTGGSQSSVASAGRGDSGEEEGGHDWRERELSRGRGAG